MKVSKRLIVTLAILALFIVMVVLYKFNSSNDNARATLSTKEIDSAFDAKAVKIKDDRFIVLEKSDAKVLRINTGDYNIRDNELIYFSSDLVTNIENDKDFVLDEYLLKNKLIKSLDINIKSALKLKEQLKDDISLIDVRTLEEYDTGHLKDAINIDVASIQYDIKDIVDKDKLIITYCRSGNRSSHAQRILENMGYTVLNAGGIADYNGDLVK